MRKYKRLQRWIHGTLPRSTKNKSGTVAVRHSPNGTQCAGQIQFARDTGRRNITPTFDENGRYVHIVSSKVKFTPSHLWRGNGRSIKARVKFTREQRISTAKALAHKNRVAIHWRVSVAGALNRGDQR